jgi:hypothetical protein
MMRPAGDLPSYPVIVMLTAVEDEPGIFVRPVSGADGERSFVRCEC